MTDSKKAHSHVVESSDYRGPERRADQCSCHLKHQRVLDQHDKDLESIKVDREKRRKDWEDRMDVHHRDMWTDIKAKVPNKLFYTFISVYSLLFIFGIVSVYKGMHQSALAFQSGISDVKVMQTELKASVKAAESRIDDVRAEVRDLKQDIKAHMDWTQQKTAPVQLRTKP